MRLRNIPGSQEVIDRSGLAVIEPEKQKGSWHQLFQNDAPIYIEVGMGKGRFLMDMAQAHPENNYIGIEMYSSVLIRALQKAYARILNRSEEEQESLPISELQPLAKEQVDALNFRFIRMDARQLADVFEKGEIAGIYLNFSDPWPKDRHADRRLTSGKFLARYAEILPDDGVVEFKTDNQDLFSFSLESVKESGWKLLASTRDLHHDPELNKGNIMTEYEERFSSKGNPICKLIAQVPKENA